MSSLVTIRYVRIAGSDLTGSSGDAPELSACRDAHLGLMSRRKSDYCVNFEALLAGWARWDTRRHGAYTYNEKFQGLRLAPGSPGLTARTIQGSSSAAGKHRDKRTDAPTRCFWRNWTAPCTGNKSGPYFCSIYHSAARPEQASAWRAGAPAEPGWAIRRQARPAGSA